jgi:hypothetical protein
LERGILVRQFAIFADRRKQEPSHIGATLPCFQWQIHLSCPIVEVMKTVAVIGASPNRAKWGNKAVRAFQSQGYTVHPVHPAHDQVEGLPCFKMN